MTTLMELPFKSIAVQVGSGFNLITLEEWKAIPSADKIKMITAGKVKFLDESGGKVPISTALQAIKDAGI